LEKTCPSATLFTTNPTWPDPSSNPGRRGGKLATHSLSYGTANKVTISEEQCVWDEQSILYFRLAIRKIDISKIIPPGYARNECRGVFPAVYCVCDLNFDTEIFLDFRLKYFWTRLHVQL
jgi:hypothetical protein